VLAEAERAAGACAAMAGGGVRLDEQTVRALARERARAGRWRTLGLWLVALALLGILSAQLGFTWR
jgi:hypothetical protein